MIQGLRGSLILLVAGLALGVCRAAPAQDTTAMDGPHRQFQDSLFDRLAGTWTMTGTVAGEPAVLALRVEWVLNHQFLRLSMADTAKPPQYEAIVFIGRDNLSDRYVAHWLDVFGGRWSETLGYGVREGNSVEFVFEYPDGPFRTRFTHLPQGGWSVLMRQKNSAGGWETFADYRIHSQ